GEDDVHRGRCVVETDAILRIRNDVVRRGGAGASRWVVAADRGLTSCLAYALVQADVVVEDEPELDDAEHEQAQQRERDRELDHLGALLVAAASDTTSKVDSPVALSGSNRAQLRPLLALFGLTPNRMPHDCHPTFSCRRQRAARLASPSPPPNADRPLSGQMVTHDLYRA